MSNNKNLRKAKKAKNDEFYTQYADIAKELPYYKEQLADKIIYCNCDNPKYSNFYKFFKDKFEEYKLKSVIATYFNANEYTYKTTFDGTNEVIEPLNSYGDFRSATCRDILSNTDVVITNPPFSLFRDYIAQLIEYDKKFLVLGNMNAITYKEIFSLIKDNKMWLGYSIHSGDREFLVSNRYSLNAAGYRVDEQGNKYIRVKGVRWFTNLDYPQRYNDLLLDKHYNLEEYPKYDNYNAINVNKTKDIPIDYDELIGVPITFMDKYNPEQFEIVDAIGRYALLDTQGTNENIKKRKSHACNINGKATYFRIVIKRKSLTV